MLLYYKSPSIKVDNIEFSILILIFAGLNAAYFGIENPEPKIPGIFMCVLQGSKLHGSKCKVTSGNNIQAEIILWLASKILLSYSTR